MVKWAAEEEEALCAGVKKYGKGKWQKILKDPDFSPTLSHRSNIDIKDKWRSMEAKWKALATNLLIDEDNQAPAALVDDKEDQAPAALVDEQINQEGQAPAVLVDEQINQEGQAPAALVNEQINQEDQACAALVDEQINQEGQAPAALVDEQINQEDQARAALVDEQINQEGQARAALVEADTSISQDTKAACPHKTFIIEALLAAKESTESEIGEFLEFIEANSKNKLVVEEDVSLLQQVVRGICRKFKKQKTNLGM